MYDSQNASIWKKVPTQPCRWDVFGIDTINSYKRQWILSIFNNNFTSLLETFDV